MEGKNESKHTPEDIHLEISENEMYGYRVINVTDPKHRIIFCDCHLEKAYAEIIVKSVNSAPALLEENEKLKADLLQETGKNMRYTQTIEDQKDKLDHFESLKKERDDVKKLFDSERAEVDRLKNDLKHSEERADQRLDSYTKMANYATEFKVEVDRLTKEKSEILEASQVIVDALVKSNVYMKELAGGVFGEHALKNYEDLLTRIK